jgi:phage recombination protein Bet
MTTPFDVLSPEQAGLIRRTVTRNLSDDEHELFLEAAQRSGLDPFARHIYPLREGKRFTIQATIDGLRLSAERTGSYRGQLGPEWCGEDGVWKDIWTEQFPPTAARVGILRSDFAEPVWGKALYSEFVQDGEFWRGMPALMLSKCAEALGFRKAFPLQFSGLYTPEEMRTVANSATLQFPGNSNVPTSEGPIRAASTAINPDQGGGPPTVPLPLQPFFEAGLSNRRNLQAAYRFLQGELEHALGEAGFPAFRRIYAQHLGHGLFSSKAKCEAANRACMIELYAAVGRVARPDSEAA